MKTTVKLYGPAILLLVWAVLLFMFDAGWLAVAALVSIGWSVKVQVDETLRQHSNRVRRR